MFKGDSALWNKQSVSIATNAVYPGGVYPFKCAASSIVQKTCEGMENKTHFVS